MWFVRNQDGFSWGLDYNRDLVKGLEFGGWKSGAYLPALDRYEGRFFQALGNTGTARCGSNDNLLIVSALYGLVRTSEPMQLYSCPLLADVAAIWLRGGLLTDIVRACVDRTNVLRVFDLTTMHAYRRLIDWERVASDRTDVLPTFDSMAAGESALTSFGRFFRYLLSLGDDELLGLNNPLFATAFPSRKARRIPRSAGCPASLSSGAQTPRTVPANTQKVTTFTGMPSLPRLIKISWPQIVPPVQVSPLDHSPPSPLDSNPTDIRSHRRLMVLPSEADQPRRAAELE